MNFLNKNYKVRNAILGLPIEFNDICRFGDKKLEDLINLLHNQYIATEETQNDSPTVEEFYNFLKKYPEVTFHGYAVSNKRDDYRVSIEGLEYAGDCSRELIVDFVKLCKSADELDVETDYLRSWWD